MAIRNFANLYLVVAALAVACQVQEPQHPQAPETTEPAVSMENPPTVSGLVSVQFDDALAAMVEDALSSGEVVPTKAPGMNDLLEELGIDSMERVFPDAFHSVRDRHARHTGAAHERFASDRCHAGGQPDGQTGVHGGKRL